MIFVAQLAKRLLQNWPWNLSLTTDFQRHLSISEKCSYSLWIFDQYIGQKSFDIKRSQLNMQLFYRDAWTTDTFWKFPLAFTHLWPTYYIQIKTWCILNKPCFPICKQILYLFCFIVYSSHKFTKTIKSCIMRKTISFVLFSLCLVGQLTQHINKIISD